MELKPEMHLVKIYDFEGSQDELKKKLQEFLAQYPNPSPRIPDKTYDFLTLKDLTLVPDESRENAIKDLFASPIWDQIRMMRYSGLLDLIKDSKPSDMLTIKNSVWKDDQIFNNKVDMHIGAEGCSTTAKIHIEKQDDTVINVDCSINRG